MLSVAQSAELLNVSPTRVRALIASGLLPAEKAGRAWVLREEDVMQRASLHARPGRPSNGAKGAGRTNPATADVPGEDYSTALHDLYLGCREAFRFRPDSALLMGAESPEEAAFYVAVADFFLAQRQRELVRCGAY